LQLLVEDKVIVEVKSVEKLLPIHEAQLITYLKLTGYRVGLLINFNEKLLMNGIANEWNYEKNCIINLCVLRELRGERKRKK